MATFSPIRLLLLALLPAVGMAVWWDGQRYDPGLLNFKQQGALSGSQHLLPEQLLGVPRLPTGVRRYDKSNLHDYVNGHAEYYFGAGFSSLTVGDYGRSEGVPQLTVDIFHMGTPLQAFGVLMDESSGKAAPMAGGAFGHGDQRGWLFMQGPYFIRLTSFSPDLVLANGVGQLQQTLASSPGGVMTFRFPPLGEPGAIRYIKENYRGLDFIHGVVERTLQWHGETVRVFRRDGTDKELTALEEAIRSFFKDSGADIVREERQGVVFTRIEDPYEGKWFYFRDGEGLVGVFSPWREEWVDSLLTFVKDHGRNQKTLP